MEKLKELRDEKINGLISTPNIIIPTIVTIQTYQSSNVLETN